MNYRLEVDNRAAKQIANLQVSHQERVIQALEALSNDPRPRGCVMLKGRADYSWRIKIGDYRVLYRIRDDLHLVRVYGVLRRDQAYRD